MPPRLRYGKLMLMADQDSDGLHIKGLVISMVHHFWPELLAKGFLQEFQTPLPRRAARRRPRGRLLLAGRVRAAGQPDRGGARCGPAKGLGTSTAKEAREYFERRALRSSSGGGRARGRGRSA